ncbi:MAG: PEP-CTERM sorting domain-containing protein [Pirellulales bacterium]
MTFSLLSVPCARRLFAYTSIVFVALAVTCAPVRANVTFSLNITDGVNEGFNDPVLGGARVSAMNFALNTWSQLLSNSYLGETINVSASFDAMGGSAFSAVLGSAGANFIHANFGGASLGNTWYGSPLANHLAGFDLNAAPEIVAQFNSDVDNATVLGTTDWYYGTDGNPGGDIDFVSVVLHEVGHGLNFFDVINQNGTWLVSNRPGIYDRFLVDAPVGGTALTAMTDAQRAAAIISNSLYWSGANGVAANGGVRPKIYAPNPYEPGSSVAHLDESTFPLELMSPFYSGPDHIISPIHRGMMIDMGWQIVPEPSTYVLLVTGGMTGLLGVYRRRRILATRRV